MNNVVNPFGRRLGQLQAGADRSGDVDDELARVAGWKQSHPQPRKKQHRTGEQRGRGDDHHQLMVQGGVQDLGEARGETAISPVKRGQWAATMVGTALLARGGLAGLFGIKPTRTINRDYRHRHQIGGHHRENHRQRKCGEQIPADAVEKNHRQKDHDRADGRGEHRVSNFLGPLARRLDRIFAHREMAIDVLQHDRGVVHQAADRQGETAQRHQVDGLPDTARPATPARSDSGIDKKIAKVERKLREDQDHQRRQQRAR